MKNNCLCATLLGFWAALGLAQTTEELVNDGKNTENVTTQSMGYDRFGRTVSGDGSSGKPYPEPPNPQGSVRDTPSLGHNRESDRTDHLSDFSASPDVAARIGESAFTLAASGCRMKSRLEEIENETIFGYCICTVCCTGRFFGCADEATRS